MGAYVKDLKFQWGNHLKRTVLVDNNPMSFLANPSNGILVPNFYNDPHDTALPEVLSLLEELNEEEDVRPMLESRFGLKQSLKESQSGRSNNNSATKSPAVSALSGGVQSKRLRPVRKPKMTSDCHRAPQMMLSIIVEEAEEGSLKNDPVSDVEIQPAQTVHDQVEPMDWEPIDYETQSEEPCPTVTTALTTTQKCHRSKRLRPVRKLKLTSDNHRVPHMMLSTIVEEVVEDKEIEPAEQVKKITGEAMSKAPEDDENNAASETTMVDPVLEVVVQPAKTRDSQTEPAQQVNKITSGAMSKAAEDDENNAASETTMVDPVLEVVVQPAKTRDNQTEPAEQVKKIPGKATLNRATVLRRSARIAATQLHQCYSPAAAGPESKASTHCLSPVMKQKAQDPTAAPSPRRSARIASKPRIQYRM
jgi:hypothetical protein